MEKDMGYKGRTEKEKGTEGKTKWRKQEETGERGLVLGDIIITPNPLSNKLHFKPLYCSC